MQNATVLFIDFLFDGLAEPRVCADVLILCVGVCGGFLYCENVGFVMKQIRQLPFPFQITLAALPLITAPPFHRVVTYKSNEL